MTKILVMGLPGSGKSTLAKLLSEKLSAEWLNADDIRKKYNDWDFTYEGRIRQSTRMHSLAYLSSNPVVIADFVAPLPEMRVNFHADWTIWMDTIDSGRFEDTNKMFVPPDNYDFRITEKNAEKWVEFILEHIQNNKRRPVFDWKKETTQMLGRWQPWHGGHRALFERALAKKGQVIIQIRDCQGWNGSNPFESNQVINFIKRDLDPIYQGQYEVMMVPNITHITYGRQVGYTIEQEVFDEATHAINATDIRKSMGLN